MRRLIVPRTIKLALAALVLCGLISTVVHFTHSAFDRSHNEASCQLCIGYNGLASTTSTVAVAVAILLASPPAYSFPFIETLRKLSVYLVHSALDPPQA
jgi:hypothetical protein